MDNWWTIVITIMMIFWKTSELTFGSKKYLGVIYKTLQCTLASHFRLAYSNTHRRCDSRSFTQVSHKLACIITRKLEILKGDTFCLDKNLKNVTIAFDCVVKKRNTINLWEICSCTNKMLKKSKWIYNL